MKTSINGASNALSIVASILCLGGILGFVNAKETDKPLILNLVCASVSLAVGSKLSSTFSSHEAEYQAEKITQSHELVIKRNQQENTDLAQRLTKQTTALTEAKTLIQKHEQTITERERQVTVKENLVSKLNKELEKAKADIDTKINEKDTRYEFVCQELKQVFQETLKEKIDYTYERLADISTVKMNDERFENIHPTLNLFYDCLDNHRHRHYQLKSEIFKLNNESLAENLSNIFLQITDELSALKVKFRNTLNVDERDSLALAMEELLERRDTKKFIPKPKVDVVLDLQKNAAKEDLDKIKVQAFQAKESLREIREEVRNFIGQLESKNEEIAALKQPQVWRFAQGSNELSKGNLIINYFWGKGIRLDRAFTVGDVYESKIYFHTDNNPRTLVFKELNEHSEALQQLTLTLKPITFDWDADKGLMVASITWKAKEKKEQLDELSDEAINRLARSWDTWKKHAKKWNRIRITGGSGTGKSPLTERIISEQLQHKKVKGIDAIKLYNPQAGSRKDNWSFPSFGKTHRDSIRGVAELAALCGQKYQGAFSIWIFDEVDSTLREAPGKQRPTKDDPEPEPTMSANILSIITQIDHTSQAVFYLGQGANTGKIPNTTKGDWNNLVAIHINGNTKDYLRLAEHIDSESQDKLMKQADLLQRYIDRKNSELGLDRVDPGAYRYALIDEYGEKQYYVLLPLFSADEFLDTLTTPVQVETTVEPAVSVPQIQCPHCQSKDFKKHSRVTDAHKYRYSCLNIECKKTFVADRLINSN